MNTRVLPREEWHRLAETNNPQICGSVPPDDVRVVVVEDGGKIVGSMAVIRVTHLENIWLEKPRAGVASALIKAAHAEARQWAKGWIMANVGWGRDRVAESVEAFGGSKIPVDTYLMPLGG